MRCLALACALLTAATPAFAQAPLPATPPGTANPARVVAGNYAIEPNHTQVMFTLDHFGFSLFRGFLSNVSGTLTLDPKNAAAAKLSVTVPIASIATTSQKLNEELLGPEWFDVQHFPNATFVSTRITPSDHDWTVVDGNLTIRGITHPAQMRVRLHGAGKSGAGKGIAIGFDGRLTLNRSEYGLGRLTPLVSDHVELTIAAAFEQQQ
jgi:polyisoprenoid-binding protein YceI